MNEEIIKQITDEISNLLSDITELINDFFEDLFEGDSEFEVESASDIPSVKLSAPGIEHSDDTEFWDYIKTKRLDFTAYKNLIDDILCTNVSPTTGNGVLSRDFDKTGSKVRSPFIGIQEYNVLKFATEAYMLTQFGIDPGELTQYLSGFEELPYYRTIIERLDDYRDQMDGLDADSECKSLWEERLQNPFLIELLWSYWMEQGMLVQTLNLISLRFQNMRGRRDVDAISRFNTDPLRPLSHIIWGYVQDEQHRLSMTRRVYEYDHEYGLVLTGRAIPPLRPVDSRSKFLAAFHNLLNSCTLYYKDVDDMTRRADGFPILNNLKEVHLLLAEGNHNAYGNLTWTARQEMLMQQYILARNEMREFMGGRIMVPYPENWMDRVDTMKDIQGWGSTSISYFYELAIYGEQILLSCRYGNWSDVGLTSNNASNWAIAFRDSIQRYIHAYRVVTGIDLSSDILQSQDRLSIQPSYFIQQRSQSSQIERRLKHRIPLKRLS